MTTTPKPRGVLPCSTEGCDKPGVYGFGFPGLRKDLPENKRGRRYACDEHRAEANERWQRATGMGLE